MVRLLAGGVRIIAIALAFLVMLAVTHPWYALGAAGAIAFFVAAYFHGRTLERKRGLATDVRLLSPIEYEQFCAETLRAAGWSVKTTSLQDQGVDVIAELRGVRAVIQCKKYRSRVGNAAVQQVVAGKRHYRAVVAAVVAPAGYTRAAEALARSNGVMLLHHEDLAKLERLARIP